MYNRHSIFLAAALALPSAAMAQGLSVVPLEGGCPGVHDISITGLTPGGSFGLVSATGPGGGVTVPDCGFNTDIGPAGFALRVSGTASPDGSFQVSPAIPGPACGVSLQVVDLDACSSSNVSDFVNEALVCGCGEYTEGDRVVAMVDSPAGASGILAGDSGVVVAGNDSVGFETLVQWDGWDGGHDGNCGSSDCGECEPSASDNRWYVACDDIGMGGPVLECACDGAFAEGQRVSAAVDSPAGASGIVAGDMGTVVAGMSGGPDDLQILVHWDAWASGHDGNCAASECGECVDDPANARWWVGCAELD
ncbi:MAG: hypothetical protein ACI9K2_006778 [Myxococcota bacterium]|jgi:hypothetical protein